MLEIKNYFSPDIDEVWNWTPNSLNEVHFGLEFDIGLVGEEEANIFSVTIATPEALRTSADLYASCYHFDIIIIVFNYQWLEIEKKLNEILKECDVSNDLFECAQLLKKYFLWEYDNHSFVD